MDSLLYPLFGTLREAEKAGYAKGGAHEYDGFRIGVEGRCDVYAPATDQLRSRSALIDVVRAAVHEPPLSFRQTCEATVSPPSPIAQSVAATEDEAIFGTDEDGDAYSVTVKTSTTWLLRPYYSKASPRRGLGAPYSILIEPQATTPAPAPTTSPAPANNATPSPLFPARP